MKTFAQIKAAYLEKIEMKKRKSHRIKKWKTRKTMMIKYIRGMLDNGQ